MSDTKHYKGKLKPTNKTLAEYAGPDADIYDTELYEQVVLIDGLIYEVEKEGVNVYEDIYRSSQNMDGTIDFEVKYYNGGCSFNEAVDHALAEIRGEHD